MHRLKAMKETLVTIAEGALANADQVCTEELGEVVDMIKDLEEAMYHCLKNKKLEYELCELEKYKEMQHYHFIPYPVYETRERDMDREEGRMYYTEPYRDRRGRFVDRSERERDYDPYRKEHEEDYNKESHPVRDSREGRSPMTRRNYMESKELHKDKEHKIKELEKYMQELSQDIVEMIEDASPEEKQMLEKKMTNLASKVAQLNRNA